MGHRNTKHGGRRQPGGHGLNLLTREIVDATLELFQGNVHQILLYGSYARGDSTAESDIDLMVLLDCTKEEANLCRKKANKMASKLSLEHDIEVSLLLRDKETFEHGRAILPFYRNVANEGIVLYG